jgi:hypothetical protein
MVLPTGSVCASHAAPCRGAMRLFLPGGAPRPAVTWRFGDRVGAKRMGRPCVSARKGLKRRRRSSVKLQDSLEVSEEPLDLLTVLARLPVSTGLGNFASDIACRFVDATSDLPSRCIRTAASLHRAVGAIGLAGSIDDGVSLGDVGTQVLEGAPLAAQHMALRAAVFVGLGVPLEVTAR